MTLCQEKYKLYLFPGSLWLLHLRQQQTKITPPHRLHPLLQTTCGLIQSELHVSQTFFFRPVHWAFFFLMFQKTY